MMRTSFVAVIVAGALSISLQAQTIDSYELRYYNVGATQPFQVYPMSADTYLCNQTPIVSTITANPTRVEWDDPTASGRVCIYTEVAGGPLLSLPVGNYEATLVAINAFGRSPESNRAPFVLGSLPGVPTTFKVVR